MKLFFTKVRMRLIRWLAGRDIQVIANFSGPRGYLIAIESKSLLLSNCRDIYLTPETDMVAVGAANAIAKDEERKARLH